MLIVLLITGQLLVIGGCGFQLRGQAQLPPAVAVTYIKIPDPHSPLVRALERALEANGVTVAMEPEKATAIVEILNEEIRRRTLAVGPRGDDRNYELRYEVNYAVSLADGSQPIPAEILSVSRNLLYDETQVLGRAEGEQIMIRDMTFDLAWSIVRRLQGIEQ